MDGTLPFFKFSPVEWMKGNINLCSMSAQGVFINICKLYWLRQGDLTMSRVRRDYAQYDEEIMELLDTEVLEEKGGKVTIKFLDEQLIPTPVSVTMKRTKKPSASRLNIFYLRSKENIKEIKQNKINIKPRKYTRNTIPPDIEWVRDYCKSRNNTIDPEIWYDFYQSKGWCVGKTKMKDWEASIRTWERNVIMPGSKSQNTIGTRSTTSHVHKYRKPDIEM